MEIGMKKFNLYLTEQQKAALDKLHERTGTPIAEILRRMIDAGLEKAQKVVVKRELSCK
jgi:predicted DNA-binding protein